MLEKTVYFVKNCLINISGTFNKKLGYFLLKQPGHTGSIFGSADADGNDAQTSSPPLTKIFCQLGTSGAHQR